MQTMVISFNRYVITKRTILYLRRMIYGRCSFKWSVASNAFMRFSSFIEISRAPIFS
jgi:hypothetical protein